MGIKTDSKILPKLGNKTIVNIDSKIWTGSQNWGSGDQGHIPRWFQFHENKTCQFVNGTFKNMVSIKFNILIIKDWWFNFTMYGHMIQ